MGAATVSRFLCGEKKEGKRAASREQGSREACDAVRLIPPLPCLFMVPCRLFVVGVIGPRERLCVCSTLPFSCFSCYIRTMLLALID